MNISAIRQMLILKTDATVHLLRAIANSSKFIQSIFQEPLVFPDDFSNKKSDTSDSGYDYTQILSNHSVFNEK